ncbi:hypothetical protein BAZSYMA_ACONTIG22582_0 [Bathymodiolus azoricus thioautotrophic gill symbiont]|uniref:Uncharacterized protein n=1 Tax=Bathymodiolus azoricus thioautotrophic gill symbiont TaxID=235205 RepID=A0A1H6ME75_9GAMM|nr:hypothetical protein BAZSYMA_ACONTIG22582_0 [Bathymodiolus azoricus thioautotrophic gill symbiont]
MCNNSSALLFPIISTQNRMTLRIFKHDILYTLFSDFLNLIVHCLSYKIATTRIKYQYAISCDNK